MPTVEAWLQAAREDVTRLSRPDVRPVLDALAQAVTVLRRADWNPDAARDGGRASAKAGVRD
jgi:hypothetical protein